MSAQDGGPAFPGKAMVFLYKGDTTRTCVDVPGMSLRDWFAGQALAGLLGIADSIRSNDGGAVTASHITISAYEMADAMLAARAAAPQARESGRAE